MDSSNNVYVQGKDVNVPYVVAVLCLRVLTRDVTVSSSSCDVSTTWSHVVTPSNSHSLLPSSMPANTSYWQDLNRHNEQLSVHLYIILDKLISN